MKEKLIKIPKKKYIWVKKKRPDVEHLQESGTLYFNNKPISYVGSKLGSGRTSPVKKSEIVADGISKEMISRRPRDIRFQIGFHRTTPRGFDLATYLHENTKLPKSKFLENAFTTMQPRARIRNAMTAILNNRPSEETINWSKIGQLKLIKKVPLSTFEKEANRALRELLRR